METKKSEKANLDNRRLTHFLLGVVVALSLFFAAMEYTTMPSTDTQDEQDDLDDITDNLEMLPAMDTRDMIAAAPEAASHAITSHVKAVDHTTDNTDKINADNNNPNVQTASTGSSTTSTKTSDETTALSPVAVDQNDNPINFRVVEQLPEFPGGMVEFMKWLTKNLRYPPTAQQQKIQGKVVVSFIVNKDGTIAAQKVVHSADPLLDAEALRVIKLMPKWKPGIENDKPCRTLFAIPVVFHL